MGNKNAATINHTEVMAAFVSCVIILFCPTGSLVLPLSGELLV
jgi:hypothetical protein